jgi:hypothetical protein
MGENNRPETLQSLVDDDGSDRSRMGIDERVEQPEDSRNADQETSSKRVYKNEKVKLRARRTRSPLGRDRPRKRSPCLRKRVVGSSNVYTDEKTQQKQNERAEALGTQCTENYGEALQELQTQQKKDVN